MSDYDTPDPSLAIIHDYGYEMLVAYERQGFVPPRVSDPRLAYELAHVLLKKLLLIEGQYALDLQSSLNADDFIAARQDDLMQREVAIKCTVSSIERAHRDNAPMDFINGERHYAFRQMDPAIYRRIQERRLAKEIDRWDTDPSTDDIGEDTDD